MSLPSHGGERESVDEIIMAVRGPTQGAARHTETIDRWQSHEHLARVVRAVVLALPIAAAVVLTWGAGRLLPPERLGVGRWVWIAGAFLICNLVLVGMGRITRRITPLIALMKLSLVFPDQAPSRAKALLRRSNSRKLLREMEEARTRGDNTGAALHGEYLLQVLRELNAHDRLTRGHSERVRAYAEMLGEELKLNEEDMGKLRWAALLHDVGKLKVPEHILNKDGRPTDDEWAMLQSHPGHGGRMLEPLRPWLDEWVHAADQHHLRWDGNGYPLDLSGTEIAMAGRLVAIADAYDVMTSARSYKAPLSSEVARHELTANAGSQFDPAMVRAFLNIGLGKLRAVAGPLAWISNAVGSTQVPVPAATAIVTTAATAAAAASAVAIAAFTGVLQPEPEAEVPALAHRVVETVDPAGIVVVDLEKNAIEDQPLMIEISALGEGTISFEVGSAAHGQVLTGIVESADWSRNPEMSSMIVTYVPALDYYGEDSFDFEACNEAGSCDTATVAISIAPENDAPSAMADTAEGIAGSVISVDSLANDSDVDDTELRLVSATADSGRVSVVGGQLQFVADPDFSGTVEIEYIVADPSGETSVGIVTIEVLPQGLALAAPPTTTTTTSPTAADDPPIAANDTASTLEDVEISIDVLANDIASQGQPLSITGVSAPAYGTAVQIGGQILYTPLANYSGADSFTYTAGDGTNPDVAATVSITIASINDRPVASAPDATIAEDATPGQSVLSVSATDDDGDSLSYAIVAGDPGGTFAIDGAGNLSLAGPLDHEATPSYILTMSVTDGTVVVPVTATVLISDVDEEPTAGDDALATAEDNPIAIPIGVNDSDPEGAAITFSVPATSIGGATLTEASGVVTYSPVTDWSGSDSFTYTVADPAGNLSNMATVTIAVSPVNDAPVAADDGGVGFTTPEDTLITTYDVTANDTDVDNAVDPASITVLTAPVTGTLVNNGDGTFDFDPAPAWSGTETFTYSITDPGTITSNTATVTLAVTGVNDPPVANDDGGIGFGTVEDTLFTTADVTANDTDLEDGTIDPSTISVINSTSDGTLTNNGDGTFNYFPDLDFSGTDTFTYEVNDSGLLLSNTATVTLTITAENDAPVAADDGGVGFTTLQDTLITTADVTANDTDVDDPVDAVSVAVAAPPATGTLTNNGDGTFDFDPAPAWSGTETFTYTISDPGALTSNVATVSITVLGAADAGGPYTISEGGTLVLDGSGSTGSPTSWNWDLDNDGQYDDASGISPTVPWATLVSLGVDDDGVFPVALELNGGTNTATTILTVENIAPLLSTTGAASVTIGNPYTLNLGSIDPGNDTIGTWTINWGDGTVDSIVGNPSSVSHTYTRAGFTFNILVSASDEDGTFLQNELLVPSFDADKIFRFEETTGGFLQEFATANKPIESYVGPDGRLYVSGEDSDNVLRYNAETGAFIDEFIAPGSGGLNGAEGLAFGPDGNLYVADFMGDRILRFNGTTGVFIDVFASAGLTRPYDIVFGPDSNLYVGSYNADRVVRFDGTTGAFIDVFVSSGSGGLDTPEQMTFGPDGSLYIASFNTNEVLRYDGTTGAFNDIFVASGGVGDLDLPSGLAFGPDGNLYIGDYADHAILRYDGATGAFIDEYVAPGAGGLSRPGPMTFLPKTQVRIDP